MAPVPRICDSRLTGFRIPLSEAETRRIASLPLRDDGVDLARITNGFQLRYSNGFDVARITNGFRLQCRATVQRLDAVASWENEGGR
jgi:hypothetical protein